MATRLEKTFRTNALHLTNSILNEVNVLVEQSKNKKISREELDREWARVLANITRSICGFYDKNNITDEEIRIAVDRKNKNA